MNVVETLSKKEIRGDVILSIPIDSWGTIQRHTSYHGEWRNVVMHDVGYETESPQHKTYINGVVERALRKSRA